MLRTKRLLSLRHKVAILGSGNWGSAISVIIGNNTKRQPKLFDTEVKMWVFEEIVDGKKLTEIINTQHENIKYLPGYKIPENVVACPDLLETVKGASILVFVLPEQFLPDICEKLKGHVDINAIGVSLIKGISLDEHGPVLMSDIITDALGIDVSVLMGANIASEIADGKFCESTIGYRKQENAILLKMLFDDKNFRVSIIKEVEGVEICGALKNVVALAAGVVDGLGLGNNTKATIMRIGLEEIRKFTKLFFKEVNKRVYFESCGIADLIVTCYGGRNRLVGEEFVKDKTKSVEELEATLLKGQKLQGVLTAEGVYKILQQRNLCEKYPLFSAVYEMFVSKTLDPNDFINYIRDTYTRIYEE